MPPPPREPRSFWLSRGPGDLGLLFVCLLYGVILIISPTTAQWILRAFLLVCALFLAHWTYTLRHFIRADLRLRFRYFKRAFLNKRPPRI